MYVRNIPSDVLLWTFLEWIYFSPILELLNCTVRSKSDVKYTLLFLRTHSYQHWIPFWHYPWSSEKKQVSKSHLRSLSHLWCFWFNSLRWILDPEILPMILTVTYLNKSKYDMTYSQGWDICSCYTYHISNSFIYCMFTFIEWFCAINLLNKH